VAAYYALKFISKIICLLPWKVVLILGNALGALALKISPSWRLEMAAANIQECLGLDAEAAKIVAEKSLSKFGRMIMEVLRFPLLNAQNIDANVKVDGMENLEKAYAEGHGVIMATGHFGNWELLGAMVGLHGYPIMSIARKQNNGAVDKFINEYREMVGQKIVYNRGENEVLALSRMLKAKNLLGILFDQDTNDVGVKIKLFGKEVITPAGPAVFSRMFKAPILPIFMHYDADGSCRAKIYPPLYAPKTKNKEQDLYDVTEQLIAILEQEIRSNPPMWFWVHDRWKDGRQRFDHK
jgi:KDO2-lipid IV(A) lauroyltransferase